MNYSILTIFDVLLVLTLLWLAWNLLNSEDIFKAVVLFISFGLLMAIAWVRMRAPDVALAEAALGAGLSGPLFLSALRRMNRIRKGERRLAPVREKKTVTHPARHTHQKLNGAKVMLFLCISLLTILLANILLTAPGKRSGLAEQIARFQADSGVESPVTAVLLNFRGYDTLLEIMVLLLAVIGAWSLTRAHFPRYPIKTSSIQLGVVQFLAPLMCLVGFYLVYRGSHLAGGAFQGGAILGAAGVLLIVTELPWLPSIPSFTLRFGLVLGPIFFLAVASCCLLFSREFLAYPTGSSHVLILFIETICAISIGLTLASLFAGGRPAGESVERKQTSSLPPSGDPS